MTMDQTKGTIHYILWWINYKFDVRLVKNGYESLNLKV